MLQIDTATILRNRGEGLLHTFDICGMDSFED